MKKTLKVRYTTCTYPLDQLLFHATSWAFPWKGLIRRSKWRERGDQIVYDLLLLTQLLWHHDHCCCDYQDWTRATSGKVLPQAHLEPWSSEENHHVHYKVENVGGQLPPPMIIYCLYSESFPAESSFPLQKYTEVHNGSDNDVPWDCVLAAGDVGLHLI